MIRLSNKVRSGSGCYGRIRVRFFNKVGPEFGCYGQIRFRFPDPGVMVGSESVFRIRSGPGSGVMLVSGSVYRIRSGPDPDVMLGSGLDPVQCTLYNEGKLSIGAK